MCQQLSDLEHVRTAINSLTDAICTDIPENGLDLVATFGSSNHKKSKHNKDGSGGFFITDEDVDFADAAMAVGVSCMGGSAGTGMELVSWWKGERVNVRVLWLRVQSLVLRVNIVGVGCF